MCWKSYLMFLLLRNYLLSNGVDALDDENEHLLDRHALGLEIRPRIKDEKQCMYFLDEIQNVEGFEKVINGLLHKPNVDVYVTGSNSRFLSSDIITEFRGRGNEVRARPLSFRKIIDYKRQDKAKTHRRRDSDNQSQYRCSGSITVDDRESCYSIDQALNKFVLLNSCSFCEYACFVFIRNLECLYERYNKESDSRYIEIIACGEASFPYYCYGYCLQLRNQPHDFLLSFPGYL